MTSPRITDRSMTSTSLAGMQANLARLAQLQQQLSAGKTITKPSDAPAAIASAMQMRGQLKMATQYGRNAQDGASWLGTVDNALRGAVDQVQRARDLALQGSSSGSMDASAREAIAVEIEGVRQTLLATANTSYLGRPVFGGTTASPSAYDGTGNYVGDGGTVQRTLAEGLQVRVDTSGPSAFGSGPSGLFGVLDSMVANLRTNPGAVAGDIDNLDTAMAALRTQVADVGTRYNQLTGLRDSVTTRQDFLTADLSDLEDVDLPKTITDLQLQQTAYQAALTATAKIAHVSLVDFLR